MREWGLVSRLLDNADAHTNFIGTIGLTVFFLLRILVLCFAADDVFNDAAFDCGNTDKRGCREQCYDEAFPISPVRFWTMQLIFVAVPTLIYLAQVTHVTRKEKKLREQLASTAPRRGGRKLRAPRYTDESGRVNIKGKLLFTYMFTLLMKIAIEALSIYGQYRLYRYLSLPGEEQSYLDLFNVKLNYRCNARDEVGHQCGRQIVECFMPRPAEKTWTLRYMVGVACFSVFLNVIEMVYLICKMKCCFRSCKRRNDGREVLVEEEVLEVEEDSQSGCNAPSYATAMLQNNNVIVEMENMSGQSSSGGLDGDDGAAAALISLTKRTAPKTAKLPAPQPPKN